MKAFNTDKLEKIMYFAGLTVTNEKGTTTGMDYSDVDDTIRAIVSAFKTQKAETKASSYIRNVVYADYKFDSTSREFADLYRWINVRVFRLGLAFKKAKKAASKPKTAYQKIFDLLKSANLTARQKDSIRTSSLLK